MIGLHPGDQQGGAAHIVHRIGDGNVVGQNAAGVHGGDAALRYEQHRLQVVRHLDGRGVQLLVVVHYHQAETAVHCCGHVVRVALDGCRHFQQVVGGEGVVQQSVGGNEAGGDSSGAAAHTPAQGYGVMTFQRQRGHRNVCLAVEERHGTVGKVLGVGGQLALALSIYPHGRGGGRFRGYDKAVPQVQGHAQAVVAGAEVGGRCRGAHFYGGQGGLRSHAYPLCAEDSPGLASCLAGMGTCEISGLTRLRESRSFPLISANLSREEMGLWGQRGRF